MILVDAHCHLDLYRGSFKSLLQPKAQADIDFDQYYSTDEIIRRAEDADVRYMVTIGDTLFNLQETLDIVEAHSNVFRTIGIQPENSQEHLEKYSEKEIADIFLHHGNMPQTIGLGEFGLDYHRGRNDEKAQKLLFNLQMELAEQLQLPVEIHSRAAQEDTIEILRAHPNVKGLVHCFSGEKYFADAIVDLGYSISVGGTVTYKNSNELRETLKIFPLDKLLFETDAPFLAPVPNRGKINEPAFVRHTAQSVAELFDIPLENLAQQTTENFFKLFPKVR